MYVVWFGVKIYKVLCFLILDLVEVLMGFDGKGICFCVGWLVVGRLREWREVGFVEMKIIGNGGVCVRVVIFGIIDVFGFGEMGWWGEVEMWMVVVLKREFVCWIRVN